jgi:hypothetical protein
MMPAPKTTAKKTQAQSVKKPAKKAPKKTFRDEVWEAIAQLHKENEEARKRFDLQLEENRKAHEADRKVREADRKAHEAAIEAERKARKESWKSVEEAQEKAWKAHKETEKAIKETQKNIGGLNNTMGSLVERVMTPGLPLKFREFGFTFDQITTVKWTVEGHIYAEIDGLLENGSQAMVVEVKTTLRRADVDEHIARMKKVRSYADTRGDTREFYCAVASPIVDKDTKGYALSHGVYVIEPLGKDVKVTQPVSPPLVW